MRNLFMKVATVPVATVAMTVAAYAGTGGGDVGSAGVIFRAITHIWADLSSMF